MKLRGFQKLTSIDDALQRWFSFLQINKERDARIPLDEAHNRILAQDVVAEENLPRFDRSAVDGYALNAENTTEASQFKPILLTLTEASVLEAREAKQVWTGNPIPRGADAVVMIEHTQKRNEQIEVWSQLAPGENVSKKGEDIRKGETAIENGTRLNPYHLGLLAALGKTQVSVTEKPKIGILATGNELADASSKLSASQIHESNRIMLIAMCRELGAEPMDLGIARDDLDEISNKIRGGLGTADGVITTGGTSVGGLDLVPEAVNNLGSPGIIIHGVAMRPGMPTALGVIDGKPLMVLSGNPVAAVIGFEAFARPLICKMLGMKKEEPRPEVKAVMTRRVSAALGRKTFVRVKVFEKNGQVLAEPLSAKGSGAISTMTRANGFVIVPEEREGIAEGELVMVRMFGSVERYSSHV